MEKYTNIKGEVGVIISTGYGAAWSTWAADEKDADVLRFHPQLVDYLLHTNEVEAKEVKNILEGFLNDNFFLGLDDEFFQTLTVVWVKAGEYFYIDEYDGYENVVRQREFSIA